MAADGGDTENRTEGAAAATGAVRCADLRHRSEPARGWAPPPGAEPVDRVAVPGPLGRPAVMRVATGSRRDSGLPDDPSSPVRSSDPVELRQAAEGRCFSVTATAAGPSRDGSLLWRWAAAEMVAGPVATTTAQTGTVWFPPIPREGLVFSGRPDAGPSPRLLWRVQCSRVSTACLPQQKVLPPPTAGNQGIGPAACRRAPTFVPRAATAALSAPASGAGRALGATACCARKMFGFRGGRGRCGTPW